MPLVFRQREPTPTEFRAYGVAGTVLAPLMGMEIDEVGRFHLHQGLHLMYRLTLLYSSPWCKR
mgnify:CR=1 FL=1